MTEMMLNDVAVDISRHQNSEYRTINDIDSSQAEDDEQRIKYRNLIIREELLEELEKNLEKKYGKSYPSVSGYVNLIIQERNRELELQQHTASLLFDGKDPRKDVLEKLLLLANELELDRNFPNIKRQYVQNIIKTVLHNPDPRTLKKYVKCITHYVESATGKQIYFYQDYYLENFKTTVLEKIRKSEKVSNEETVD